MKKIILTASLLSTLIFISCASVINIKQPETREPSNLDKPSCFKVSDTLYFNFERTLDMHDPKYSKIKAQILDLENIERI